MKHGKLVKNVDAVVADFTKKILGMAREEGVDFAAIGKRPTRTDEVMAVLKENVKVTDKLLKA